MYKSKERGNEEKEYFLNVPSPTLSETSKERCEGKLSLHECEIAIKLFKCNKSPGNDGLSIEFYRKFWNIVGTHMIECFNYCYNHGEMTVSQRQAIITLIEKYGKDRLYIKNWRPISLLNVDYKIATKALALRIKNVLPEIIDIDQTGYINGRQIFQSIRVIQDVMEVCMKENKPGMMLLVDFEKAFDSLEWDFLYKALDKFNFGNSFIRWVKTLYTNISSCIINQGITTQYFELKRGTRQGDPLSGYLFIIALELFGQAIRLDENIHGIDIGNNIIKLTMYVDDMTVFMSDEASGNRVFELLRMFKAASGLNVNIDKTEGIWLGRNKNCTHTPFGIKWPKEPFKALGIYFSYDKKAAENYNFVTKLEKLTRQLHWWKARDLSVLGKVLLIKTIGLSKFNFVASVLNIPEYVVKDVNSLLYHFLWGNKCEKVKRDIVNQEYEFGGLKMCNFNMCIKAAKIKWIKAYLDPTVSAVWKGVFEYLCNKQNLSVFPLSNYDCNELSYLPSYYRDSVLYWNEVKYMNVIEKQDLNNELVWYNKCIKVQNKTVYSSHLLNCGLWKVNDLYQKWYSFTI